MYYKLRLFHANITNTPFAVNSHFKTLNHLTFTYRHFDKPDRPIESVEKMHS